MQEQILGYWVITITGRGQMHRDGHPHCEDAPFDIEDEALALAARVASRSTCDSVYVMTMYDKGLVISLDKRFL